MIANPGGGHVTGLSAAFRAQVKSTFILRPRDFRTAIALVSAGAASSVVFTLVPVFIVDTLSATRPWVGFYFAIVTMSSIPITLLLGRASDRVSFKRPLGLLTAAGVSAGCIFVLRVHTMGELLVVGIFLLSLIEASSAQVFAYSRAAAPPGNARTAATVSMRTAYAIGYVIGPPIGAALAVGFGVRGAIACCSVLYAASCIGYAVNDHHGCADESKTEHPPHSDRAGAWYVLVALSLTLTAPVVRSSFLVVLATSTMGIELRDVMLVVAVAPLAEIVLIPLCGVLAIRWGTQKVVALGCLSAALEMMCLSIADALWQLAALQLLGAFVVAAVVSVGMAMVQEIFEGQSGFGTSAFMATRSSSSLLGNFGGGVIAGFCGLRWTFVGAAVLAVIGTCVMASWVILRRNRAATPGKRSSHGDDGAGYASR